MISLMMLQMFAFGLNSLFELLEVSEDCYGIGYLSKVIATELANLPVARTRRKVNQATNKLISRAYKHVPKVSLVLTLVPVTCGYSPACH